MPCINEQKVVKYCSDSLPRPIATQRNGLEMVYLVVIVVVLFGSYILVRFLRPRAAIAQRPTAPALTHDSSFTDMMTIMPTNQVLTQDVREKLALAWQDTSMHEV